jgi:hypothetical protein
MAQTLTVPAGSDGLFLRGEAVAVGYSDHDLARAVRGKALHKVRHGAYVAMDKWAELDDLEQHSLTASAVVRQSRTKLVLSHTTAVIQHGAPVWDLPLADVHVTRLDRRAGRHEAGVVQHRARLPKEHVKPGHPALTTPTRTALDLTTIADVEHCLPVFDHLLHAKLTSKSELKACARQMDRSPGTLATDLVITLADGRRESVGESRTFFLIWGSGTPSPTPQYEVFDDRGFLVARTDFAWPEFKVFLEFDGKEKYLKFLREGETVVDAVLREKKREELVCRLTGWRCIRIVWADLFRPAETIAYIQSVLAGGPVHH